MAPSRTLWWNGAVNCGLTSLWQLVHSCGSLAFNRASVATPGFSALAVVTNMFELATLRPAIVECGEWQSTQPISLRQCSPRRKLLRSSRPAWHERQVSAISFEDLPVKETIFVLSPPPSTCALPGPWHDSQPVVLFFQAGRFP